jgi:hypothetical protein
MAYGLPQSQPFNMAPALAQFDAGMETRSRLGEIGRVRRLDEASQAAGARLAQGDNAGASNALYKAGAIAQGNTVRDQGHQDSERSREQKLRAADELYGALYGVNDPNQYAERVMGFAQKHGMDGNKLLADNPYEMREANLNELAGAKALLARDAKQAKSFSEYKTVNRTLVRINPDGTATPVYSAPAPDGDGEKAPSGYEFAADPQTGQRVLRAIPGGPAYKPPAGTDPGIVNNLAAGINRLAAVPSDVGESEFTSATGALQGSPDGYVLAPLARAWGSVTNMAGGHSTTEVRNRINGDSLALAAAIKPLVRKPGEGVWTDKDQELLNSIVGNLAQANNVEEYYRGLEAVRERVKANFAVDLPPITYPKGAGPQALTQRPQTRLPGPPSAAATGPRAMGQGAGPPRDAVQDLFNDPSPEAMREFDEVFGAGAAQTALGAR